LSAKTGKTVVHAARKGLIDRREWNERGKRRKSPKSKEMHLPLRDTG